jgi:predicted  nucleic acid-binding Zn-ribbon protein
VAEKKERSYAQLQRDLRKARQELEANERELRQLREEVRRFQFEGAGDRKLLQECQRDRRAFWRLAVVLATALEREQEKPH